MGSRTEKQRKNGSSVVLGGFIDYVMILCWKIDIGNINVSSHSINAQQTTFAKVFHLFVYQKYKWRYN